MVNEMNIARYISACVGELFSVKASESEIWSRRPNKIATEANDTPARQNVEFMISHCVDEEDRDIASGAFNSIFSGIFEAAKYCANHENAKPLLSMVVFWYLKSLGIDNSEKSIALLDKISLIPDSRDPRIGETWQSGRGIEKIEFEYDGRYWYSTNGSRSCYSVVKQELDSYKETHAEEVDWRKRIDEKNKLEEERLAKEKADRYNDLGFTEGMPRIKRERIIEALNVRKNWSPSKLNMTRKDFIVESVNNGWSVLYDKNGERRLQGMERSFYDEKDITKIGMDFAEYLIARDGRSVDKPTLKMNDIVKVMKNVRSLKSPFPYIDRHYYSYIDKDGVDHDKSFEIRKGETPEIPDEGTHDEIGKLKYQW